MIKQLLLSLLLSSTALADPTNCPVLDITGTPVLSDNVGMQLVCHDGYASNVDLTLLIPRWVTYDLTAAHSVGGCFKRKDNFHFEKSLPPDHRALPQDYDKSGYDQGHQAPAQDFAWDQLELSDSFSMANMAPQLPGLNRQGWEGLEQSVRDWARTRGELVVFVGPVIMGNDKNISHHHVDVPLAFWKVVYDPHTKDVLAFIMPQWDVQKGDLAPWQVTLGEVESSAHISLPVPYDRKAKPALWTDDESGWWAAHKGACHVR